MVLAFQGWNSARARTAHHEAARQRRLYRRRFGIETSYRPKNQTRAPTTSRDPVYRLMPEGLGYLIRRIWVVWTGQWNRARAKPATRVPVLPLRRLNDWLDHQLTQRHPEKLSIPMP
jgi:hypothetical protein